MAQQALVAALRQRLAALPKHELSAYLVRLDIVGAARRFDLRAAADEAQALWADSRQGGQREVAQAAAAHAADCLNRIAGVSAAAPWSDRSGESFPARQPDETAMLASADEHAQAMGSVEADWCLQRAIHHHFRGDHVAEMRLLRQARDALAKGTDWGRKLGIAILMASELPGRGAVRVRQLLDAARAAGETEVVERFGLQFRLEKLRQRFGDVSGADVHEELDDISERAKELGLARLVAGTAGMKAYAFHNSGDDESSAPLFESAARLHLQQGDSLMASVMNDMLAEIAVKERRFDEAHRRIDELNARIVGRGWRSLEFNVVATRFELALAEHDAVLAEQLSIRMEKWDLERDKSSYQGLVDYQQLLEAEAEKEAVDVQLQAARLRFSEKLRTGWMVAAVAGTLLLMSLLGVSWFVRRRLGRVNKALAEQVEAAEEARQQQAKLERRLRDAERSEGIGRIAAGVAHDFNNLLTGILVGAQLLRVAESQQEREELTDLVLTAGRQGERLCRQLKTYNGAAAFEPVALDLQELCEEMLPLLMASTKHSVSVVMAADSRRSTIDADRSQLEQTLLNLVQNAAESDATTVRLRVFEALMPSGGSRPLVAVGEPAAESGGDRGDPADDPADDPAAPAVCLECQDDGRGMERSVVDRIFDPFFTTKFPGRGLGLAVVFGSVRRHGGRVLVSSVVGKGTTFRVYLPRVGVPAAMPPDAAMPDVGLPANPPWGGIGASDRTNPAGSTAA
ncbi:MAG: nitrogen regulation protein NR(II) [Planctomycetota bacterium]